MDNDMKRRTFLGVTIGTLIALPLGVRYFAGKQKPVTHRNFAKELQKYRSMVDVPVRSIDGPASLSLPLNPPIGNEWKYVLFSPSVLPNEISNAVSEEPDAFVVREGWISVEKTPSAQTVILGGDEISKICSPQWTDERDTAEFALLLHDGKLVPAKQKGTKADPKRDTQFQHLLVLKGVPSGELKIGRRWQAASGRVLPFTYKTEYEVAGYADVGGRKTIDIRFSGSIPNMAGKSGVNKKRSEKGETMTNSHKGHAWFDLETGLLVRQEVEMTSTCTGIKGLDKSLSVDAKFFVQLFDV